MDASLHIICIKLPKGKKSLLSLAPQQKSLTELSPLKRAAFWYEKGTIKCICMGFTGPHIETRIEAIYHHELVLHLTGY